jgi:NAD(P)H dehydrogenase (quinone)
MRHLIVYAHPNPDSLNGQFKQAIAGYLKQSGKEVIVRDLYELGFDPVLSLQDMAGQRKSEIAREVKQEREFVAWAELSTYILMGRNSYK